MLVVVAGVLVRPITVLESKPLESRCSHKIQNYSLSTQHACARHIHTYYPFPHHEGENWAWDMSHVYHTMNKRQSQHLNIMSSAPIPVPFCHLFLILFNFNIFQTEYREHNVYLYPKKPNVSNQNILPYLLCL